MKVHVVYSDNPLTADYSVIYFYKQYLYEKLNPYSANIKVPNTMPTAHLASTEYFALRFKNRVRVRTSDSSNLRNYNLLINILMRCFQCT